MTNFICNSQKHNESAHHRRDPTTPSPYIEELRLQYPDVPANYQAVWQHSDDELRTCAEWSTILEATQISLQNAAQICHQLAMQSTRSQPSLLILQKNKLLSALHKVENLLTELGYRYPMPELTPYKLARKNPDIAPRIPQILHNSDKFLLLWVPSLPGKKRGTDSILFVELQEMLYLADLPRFQKWHTDFVHVYHPNDIAGVRDVDNYFYKPIIDAIARSLWSNDGYDNYSCAMYNLPSESLKPGCYIYICDRTEKVPFFDFFEDLIRRVTQPIEGVSSKNQYHEFSEIYTT